MALQCQEFGDEIREKCRVDTGIADGTDFFLIGKQGYLRLSAGMGREDGCQIAIRAYPVIVAVAHDHRTVQADIAALDGRDDFQFGTGEIFFFDTVFLFQ